MRRKDYGLIARAMLAARPYVMYEATHGDIPPFTTPEWSAWFHAVAELGSALAKDDKLGAFNYEKFRKYCGVPRDYIPEPYIGPVVIAWSEKGDSTRLP